jgi:quercetin dioxygenase-like cupin family protein
MSWKRMFVLATVVAAAVLMIVVPSTAQVAPITATILTPRSVFPDDVSMTVTVNGHTVEVADASRTVTAKFLVQPGAQFPWHTHPGPVFVNVKRGSLTYVSDECEKTDYPKGTAFVDLGHGHVHTAFNPSDTKETVLVATFFEAPAEPGPLVIPATAPAGCTI